MSKGKMAAIYLYCFDYYCGVFSREYRLLCILAEKLHRKNNFPSFNCLYEWALKNQDSDIYKALVKKYADKRA